MGYVADVEQLDQTATEAPDAGPAAPENAAPENAAPENAAPENAAPEDVAPEDVAPEGAALEVTAAEDAVPEAEASAGVVVASEEGPLASAPTAIVEMDADADSPPADPTPADEVAVDVPAADVVAADVPVLAGPADVPAVDEVAAEPDGGADDDGLDLLFGRPPLDSWFFTSDEPPADEPSADLSSLTADTVTAAHSMATADTVVAAHSTATADTVVAAPSFEDDDTVEFLPIEEPPSADGDDRPRSYRLALLGGAMVALLAGVGVGWAVIGRAPHAGVAEPAVAVAPPAQVSPAPGFSTGSRPGAAAAGGTAPSASAEPSVTPSASASAQAEQNGGAAVPSPRPSRQGAVQPAPAAPVARAPINPLTAAITQSANPDPQSLGYDSTVQIENTGSSPVNGWKVTLTLPTDGAVHDVSGAEVYQDGTTVVFTPAAGVRRVPAWGSVTFTFQVDGQPTSCMINSQPCTDASGWEETATTDSGSGVAS